MGESRESCELCNESDFLFSTFLFNTEESHFSSFCKFRYDFFLFRIILKYDKSGGAFVVLIPAGKTLFCLYRKQSDCDIDLFVSLNAMQAW